MTNKNWIGAGVIPVAVHNNKLYILLGRESKGNAKGKYDAFGGGPETYDKTPRDTAVRECYEESMGIFGTPTYIQKNIKQLIPEVETDFMLKLEYNPTELPKLFSNIYNYMKSGVIKSKKGYFEKDTIRWFPVNKTQRTTNFRKYFKQMYKYLVQNHDELVKRINNIRH